MVERREERKGEGKERCVGEKNLKSKGQPSGRDTSNTKNG
jgi:hypothetical protein